jgi:hypothetical protein
VLQPTNRFATIVLAAGSVVLLAAIGLGERMGDRVLGQATEHRLETVTVAAASPDPNQSSGPYGPDWKRSETLAAANDPRFPDPRIPPQPLPTPLPATPSARIAIPGTPTPNPNIPTATPDVATPAPSPSSPAQSVDSGPTSPP